MYNNPYFMNSGMQAARGLGKLGLFSSIRGINWGNLLNNTQKTLGIINQAIPIAYQVKPIVNNAKTMFRVIGAVSGDSKESVINNQNNTQNTKSNIIPNDSNTTTNTNQPMFFI